MMSSSTRMDVNLDVDQVDPDDLSHVWGVLTHVAEGLALDGYEVGVRLYRWRDDDDDPVIETAPVFGEGIDQP